MTEPNTEVIHISVTLTEYETIRLALRVAAGSLYLGLGADDTVARMDDLYDSFSELPDHLDSHEAAALLDEWHTERSER